MASYLITTSNKLHVHVHVRDFKQVGQSGTRDTDKLSHDKRVGIRDLIRIADFQSVDGYPADYFFKNGSLSEKSYVGWKPKQKT